MLDELRHDMLTAAGMESVKNLVDLLKPSHPAMTRLNAAKSILDRGVKLRSLVEVEFRMQALENRMKDFPTLGSDHMPEIPEATTHGLRREIATSQTRYGKLKELRVVGTVVGRFGENDLGLMRRTGSSISHSKICSTRYRKRPR